MSRKPTRREFTVTAVSLYGAVLTADTTRAGCAESSDESGLLSGIDEYCKKAVADWSVPGMAIAVVSGGEVVLARGYGVRAAGRAEAVDENTVFPIASCTKSFTAAVLARLVDQGKLHWDDPISRHVPELALPRRQGREITIRHALMHRTGYPAANMLWRCGAFDADEILRRVRLLQPVAAPGEQLVYNNVMYLAAARAAERVAGASWGELVRATFLEPLGMTSTVTDSSQLKPLENLAVPHRTARGRVVKVDRYCPDVIAPAGAIHSTVSDMARWLMLHLDQGTYANEAILTAARITEMHTPAEEARTQKADPSVPSPPISRYGLGWFVNEHAGETVVEHSGTQNGFVAWMAMVPAKRLGLVVFSNHHQTGLNYALRSWVLDRLLGRPEFDWSTSVRTDYAQGWQRLLGEAKAAYERTGPVNPTPGRPLGEYAGTYESPTYGMIHVIEERQTLRLHFGTRFRGQVKSWGKDQFRVFFAAPGLDDWLVTFAADDGRIHAMHVQESPWAPEWYDDRDDLGDFQV